MVNGGGWIIFFSFFKKNVGNFSSFAFATNILVLFLVSSLFFRENLEGQEGKLHSGIQKKKREKHFLQLQWGRGKMAAARRAGGPWKVFCGGQERKKNEFLQKKTLIQQQTRKKCSKNLFPSRISFFFLSVCFPRYYFRFLKRQKFFFFCLNFPFAST